MKTIIHKCTGKNVKELHTRAWRMDNNQIWAYVSGLPASATAHVGASCLLDVKELLKLTKGWKETKFIIYKSTKNGPLHIEVEQ